MRIGVLGATGTAGTPVVAELVSRGHRVVSLGRRPAQAVEHRRADVVSGDGLDAAFDGLDAVADCLNAKSTGKKARVVLVHGVARALAAAAEAGVGHAVSLSIVGCDAVPMTYYRIKTEQESVVRNAALPATILRATQFHGLVASAFEATKPSGVLPYVRGALQPIHPKDMAVAMADLLERGPGESASIAGPQVLQIREMAASWKRAHDSRRPLVRLPSLGGAMKAIAAEALTAQDAPRGTITWAHYLDA